MTSPLQLIAGLGNPGDRYAPTRHNAGLQFVTRVAVERAAPWRYESRLEGSVASFRANADVVRLFAPATYMNHSGRAVAKAVRYFKIPLAGLLVAHDDLNLPPGTVRLKRGGGHGGHNGLRDIFSHLGSRDFWRLRIGIGHPGAAEDVADYVLKKPPKADGERIEAAIGDALREWAAVLRGETDLVIEHPPRAGR